MISPGEISKGMTLTVLEWEPVIHEPDGFMTITRTIHRDNSYKGYVLDVQAVQLPYVVVIERDGHCRNPFTLDTRRVKLMELSAEFIAAAKRNEDLR